MGFVNWFDVQVQEEHAHAMGMFNYLNERGGQIELMSIDKPVFEGKTPLEIFEEVFKHEQFVTSRINALYEQIVTNPAFVRINQLQLEVNDLMNEVNNTITCAITGEDPKTACTHNCATCHSQCH